MQNLEFCRKDLSSLHLNFFTYSITCISVDSCIYFILWAIFCCSIVPPQLLGIVLGWLLCPFDMPILFQHCLTLWHYKMFWAHLVYSFPQLQNQPFSKEPSSFCQYFETKIWAYTSTILNVPDLASEAELDVVSSGCASCYWGIMFLDIPVDKNFIYN